MQLKDLLAAMHEQAHAFNCTIKGLVLNSQAVKPHFAFIAMQGSSQDGRAFMQDAVNRQASVIIAEKKGLESYTDKLSSTTEVPVIAIENLSEKIGRLAKCFFYASAEDKNPAIKVGVTGTNGKTTCTFLIAQTLHRLHCTSAVMGTLGYGLIGKKLNTQSLTTPDVITLHQNMADLIKQKANVIAMEVSSHGLNQDRLNGVEFDSAIFTNLTQDHLDYHQTMESYLKAKLKLFVRPELKRVIINLDSPVYDKILAKINPNVDIYFYSKTPPKLRRRDYPLNTAFVYAKHYTLRNHGIMAHIVTPWGEGELQSALLGDFNLSNLLATVTEVCAQGYPLQEVLSALYFAQGAPGRMQRLGKGDLPEVIIDYAHTPDALEKALTASRQHCKRRLWCVFGCGGGRDKDKRAKMGNIAARLADRVVITNDNPRMEPPRQIIQDIMQGIAVGDHQKVLIEEDRQKAIQYALSHALSVDTILIAGKGHENYQDLGKQKIPFNDADCVETLFAKGGILKEK